MSVRERLEVELARAWGELRHLTQASNAGRYLQESPGAWAEDVSAAAHGVARRHAALMDRALLEEREADRRRKYGR